MSDIKERCLWFIGRDRLLKSKKYDAFLYSECGEIILGCLDIHSPFGLLRFKDREQIVGITYTLGTNNKGLRK